MGVARDGAGLATRPRYLAVERLVDIRERRPDLAVPLYPTGALAGWLRRTFVITSPAVLAVDHWLPTGLRRLRPAAGLAAAVVLAAMVYALVAGLRAAVPIDQRPWLTAVLLALASWLLLRASLLLWMAPRHARFEAAWLDAQSQVVRRASFQVVRFGLQRGPYASDTAWFDLTTATGVQAVLDAAKRDDQADTWAVIEFCYPADGHIRLERTVRPIIDVLLRCDSAVDEDAAGYPPIVRFPQASYQPAGPTPAPITRWELGAEAQLFMDRGFQPGGDAP
jgi:hypothetical protein